LDGETLNKQNNNMNWLKAVTDFDWERHVSICNLPQIELSEKNIVPVSSTRKNMGEEKCTSITIHSGAVCDWSNPILQYGAREIAEKPDLSERGATK
jgi:hypothetical protein